MLSHDLDSLNLNGANVSEKAAMSRPFGCIVLNGSNNALSSARTRSLLTRRKAQPSQTLLDHVRTENVCAGPRGKMNWSQIPMLKNITQIGFGGVARVQGARK